MKTIKIGTLAALSGLLALSVGMAWQTKSGSKSALREQIFETNVTNDLNIASGEPEIAIDPRNPRRLIINEFGVGSAELPAFSMNPIINPSPEQADAGLKHGGRLMISNDGGATWSHLATPVYDPERAPGGGGGGDPMVAFGPDGTIYAGVNPFPRNPRQRGNMPAYNFTIAASTDAGKTFQAYTVGTPVDRPWIKVDQSTGTVYTASTGLLNPDTGVRNQKAEGTIEDRWLVAWKPHLAGRSAPRRMGGPDFSAGNGATMAAVKGVLAATFILPAVGFSMGAPSAQPGTIPSSLKDVVKDGTQTCTLQVPCLFFQTSSDEGQSWTRHHVPAPGGFSGFLTYVAADPGRRGRYAIGLLKGDATGLQVVVTEDSGATWSKPVALPQVAQGTAASGDASTAPLDMINRGSILKPWMDYGPTGVLGFIWKQRRDDIKASAPPSTGPGQTWGPGFDVYAAISCDGGPTWLPPARVNAEASPPGPNSFDDMSYIALDASYAHLVWGDRRLITKVTNAARGIGGVQAYYGRVPFSAVSNGAPCGRK